MKSIRRQLTLAMVGGFGLLLLGSGAAIYMVLQAALLHEFDASLRAKALAIMAQAEQNADGIQVELTEAIRQEFNNPVAPQFFQITRTNGAVLSRSESLQEATLPCRFGAPGAPDYWNLDGPGGLPVRAVGLRFQPKMEDEDHPHARPNDAVVVVAADRSPLDRTFAILIGVLGATGLLALAITVPMVRLSVRRGHAPLEELGRQAAAITAESLQVRFPTSGLPEELRPIIARFNDLLQRLEASFERERRFSADLAHELRTPLAELRTYAEVGLQFPEGPGAETYREPLNIALQMEAIVTRLLELARCENGKIRLQTESVAVAGLVAEVWQPLAGLAAEKKLSVLFAIPKETQMQTDPALFRSILANLLSNAVIYTPSGGKVHVGWRAQPGELVVSNTVHDLKPEDVPHIFERLWRKDKARTGLEHHGLGLAVSRAFAEVLGLSLSARFTDEVTLTLVLGPR